MQGMWCKGVVGVLGLVYRGFGRGVYGLGFRGFGLAQILKGIHQRHDPRLQGYPRFRVHPTLYMVVRQDGAGVVHL